MTSSEPDLQFEALLRMLREERGFDFTGYKRASLVRRVRRRMQQVGIEDFGDYVDHLRLAPDEYTALFNTLLINVTGFFRDIAAWEHLQTTLLPALLGQLDEDRPIRAWSAGSASGQEAYTLAMVLCDALGTEEFRRRVKIYGTDIDEEALTEARLATFTERDVQDVPDAYRDRYFEQRGQQYVFRKDLRRAVIFGRSDLVQDAPISHIQLLACRNTLMYFNAETQAQVLRRLHFALDDGGLLFLGKAEMLLNQAELFTPIDLRTRFFRRLPRTQRERGPLVRSQPSVPPLRHDLRDSAFRSTPLPQVVVSAEGVLLLVNERAESLLGVSSGDIGRPIQDLEISYRPLELRSLIEEAGHRKESAWRHNVEWFRQGQRITYDVQALPLVEDDGTSGTSVVFHDVTGYRRLQEELEQSNRKLSTAYEELQSTNEELETTNEELQSTVEELETTNEELQSTNEELETMNEELHSTNDEFQTINDELRERSQEVDDVNAMMQSVLTSFRDVILVVDQDLRIQIWNRPAEEMFGLRQDEVLGEHLLSLDIGLEVSLLRPALRRALAGEGGGLEVEDATDRRGRRVHLVITASPLVLDERTSGVVVSMKPQSSPTAGSASAPPAGGESVGSG